MVRTKKRAEEKLMSSEEMEKVLNESSLRLANTLEEDFDEFEKDKMINIRNDLIAVGVIRLGRRTKELTTMTTDEVYKAEKIVVDEEEDFTYIIKVLDQKKLKTGQEAPVAYKAHEYSVLLKYIEHIRIKLKLEKECNTVFTTINKSLNKSIFSQEYT